MSARSRLISFACAFALLTPAARADVQSTLETLREVRSDDPAYQALKTLEADHLLQSSPALGEARPLTRYEAAAMTDHAVRTVQERLRDPATASSVKPEDLAAVRLLLTELHADVDGLQARTPTLDNRVAVVEKKLDDRQFHMLYFLRAGTFRDQVSAYNNNLALASGTTVAANSLLGSGERIKRNTLVSGLHQNGSGYQDFRLAYDGAASPRVSYHVQMENQLLFDAASASTNPAYGGGYSTSSAIPSAGVVTAAGTVGTSYPVNTTFRLNYADVVYADPSGFSLTMGRYNASNSGLGLNYNDYFNGPLIGYARKAFSAQVGYSFNYAALSNGTAGVASYGSSGQTLLATSGYQLGEKASVGASWSTDLGANETLWNPAAGYQSSDVPISVGSVYAKYAPNKRLVFEGEGLERFGNDPFTGKHWQQPYALYLQGKYRFFDNPTGGSYVEAGLLQAGLNSLSGHTGVENTLSYYPQFIENVNGYRSAYLGVHHWVSANTRIGLEYLHYNLIPGTDMPVQTSSGACAKNACYIGRDNASAIFFQTWVQI